MHFPRSGQNFLPSVVRCSTLHGSSPALSGAFWKDERGSLQGTGV